MDKQVRICSRCVMDETDPEIRFDGEGICNHCRTYDYQEETHPKGKEAEEKLERLTEAIRKGGRNKEYDCIIGVRAGWTAPILP